MGEFKNEIMDESSNSSDVDDDDTSNSSSTEPPSDTKSATLSAPSSSSSSPSSSSSSSPTSSLSSSSSENAVESDNCKQNERTRSLVSARSGRNNTSHPGSSPARVVSNDGNIVDMENQCEHVDVGDMDLVVRDEIDETQGGTPEPHRCSSTPLMKEEDSITWKRAHSAAPYKYKRPEPVICAESVEIECMMHRAQFFLARACEENIKLAMKTSLWTTHPFIEKLLAEAYRRAPVVILIFLARNANHFSGFAQMCSEAQYKSQPAMRWVDFKGGGNIKLQWITKCSLPLSATNHIKNPFNKEKAVYAAADGCEIQRAAGQRLCSLFPFDDDVDLKALKTKMRQESHKPVSGLPSLLETKISYSEFREAKRNLPIKKTLKDLFCEERPPALLSSNKYDSRDRKIYGTESYNFFRPLPLMDVAIPCPPSNTIHFPTSSRRKRHVSPPKLSPKRRSLIRDYHHHSRSPDYGRKQSSVRSSVSRYNSYSHGTSKSAWHENFHDKRRRIWRRPSRHRH